MDYRKAVQMHLKYIIVDDKLVMTGSFNFSNTAETSNLETLHIVDAANVTEQYVKNFEVLKNYGSQEEYSDLLNRAQAGESICIWSPISLTYEQFSVLRTALFANDNDCN